MKRHCLIVFLWASIVVVGRGVELSDLSPEAQALLPEDKVVVVVLKNGKTGKGTLLVETDEEIVLKVKRSAGIHVKTTISRSTIASIRAEDLSPLLASRLLDFQLHPEHSLEEEEYLGPLALFNEFLEKCDAETPLYSEIVRLRDAFAWELEQVRKGMEKIEGEWFTPVCAAIRKFDIYTEQMQVLEKRRDFKTNKKVKEFYDGLVEKRRAAARELPRLMQERVPKLIDDQEFDESVT